MISRQVKINKLRKKINKLDQALLRTLRLRFQCAQKIAQHKHALQLAPLSLKRKKQVQKLWTQLAKENKLDVRFCLKLYNSLHQESVRLQKTVLKNIKS